MSAINIEISPAKLTKARGGRSRAEVAKTIGISRQHLWQIEAGKIVPNADILARLCLLYGVEVAELTRNSTSTGWREAAA